MAGALHYYTGDCTTPKAQAQIKSQFIQILKTSAFRKVCNDKCKVENAKVTCGLVDTGVNRNKREAGDFFCFCCRCLFLCLSVLFLCVCVCQLTMPLSSMMLNVLWAA